MENILITRKTHASWRCQKYICIHIHIYTISPFYWHSTLTARQRTSKFPKTTTDRDTRNVCAAMSSFPSHLFIDIFRTATSCDAIQKAVIRFFLYEKHTQHKRRRAHKPLDIEATFTISSSIYYIYVSRSDCVGLSMINSFAKDSAPVNRLKQRPPHKQHILHKRRAGIYAAFRRRKSI